jgi:hypothetical protein
MLPPWLTTVGDAITMEELRQGAISRPARCNGDTSVVAELEAE